MKLGFTVRVGLYSWGSLSAFTLSEGAFRVYCLRHKELKQCLPLFLSPGSPSFSDAAAHSMFLTHGVAQSRADAAGLERWFLVGWDTPLLQLLYSFLVSPGFADCFKYWLCCHILSAWFHWVCFSELIEILCLNPVLGTGLSVQILSETKWPGCCSYQLFPPFATC